MMKKIFLLCLILLLNSGLIPMAHSADQKIKLGPKDSTRFFQLLSTDTMHLVDEFYAKDVHFIDPLVELKSSEDVKHYYSSSYSGTTSVSFDVFKVISQGDEEVLIWQMKMISKKLNKGKPILVDGSSHIRYNKEGKAVYHRDYFDMGEMIYTNVPVVRGMVKYVNKRMRKIHDKTYKKK